MTGSPWRSDSDTCNPLDIDECVEEPEICALGTCSNTEGSFKCLCPEGFALSSTGRRCQGKCLRMLWAFIVLCLLVVVSCFKHGKALTLREREDVSFTHRTNDYHMPEGSFWLWRLKTHPSSFSCLYNFLGAYAPLPPPSTDADGLLGGASSRDTDVPEPGGDQL